MKWGRNKSSPPSSHRSLITRVFFPVSWFSKFKQKGGTPETSSGKKQQRGKLDFPTRISSLPTGWREVRFYSVDDDDAYWRLSFCEERAEGRRRTGRINPLWYDSDEECQVPVSSFKSFGLGEMDVSRREIHRGIDDMSLEINKMKEKLYRENILRRENSAFRKKNANRGAQLRKQDVNNRQSRKLSRRVTKKKKAETETGPDYGQRKSSKLVERDIFPIEPECKDQMKEEFRDSAVPNSRSQQIISPQTSGLSNEEDYVIADLDGEGSNATSEKSQNLENEKFKEKEVKTESVVKSAYISRRYSRKMKRTRTKAYAPKSDCRIRVLEDKKKARMMLKKKETKEQAEGCTIFNNFAVVKSSFNPQQDFKDSMVEMIRYKGIRRPEELKELLACYLTLNSDGCHDLIIKVFQQVWFELSGGAY